MDALIGDRCDYTMIQKGRLLGIRHAALAACSTFDHNHDREVDFLQFACAL